MKESKKVIRLNYDEIYILIKMDYFWTNNFINEFFHINIFLTFYFFHFFIQN